MSRMDILTQQELDSINRSSELVRRYNQTIDRESAFEILDRKIKLIEKQAAEEAARKEWEMRNPAKRGDEIPQSGKGRAGERTRTETPSRRTTTTTPRRTTTRRRTTIHPVVKVVTSATFIRGVMGILKKVI